MIATVSEDGLAVTPAASRRPAHIGREYQVTASDEELDEWVPFFCMLSVHRVPENKHSGMARAGLRTVRPEHQRRNFLPIEAAILHRFGPDESRVPPEFRRHRVCQLERMGTVQASNPQVGD